MFKLEKINRIANILIVIGIIFIILSIYTALNIDLELLIFDNISNEIRDILVFLIFTTVSIFSFVLGYILKILNNEFEENFSTLKKQFANQNKHI